ncbi:SPOR domain-containing protein [Rhodobacter sp. SGA-6-6]|nr:SPOR domain-containing protein [Rhodobacter sp. SGA-6-6]
MREGMMARASYRLILLVSAAALALGGCVEGAGGGTKSAAGGEAPAKTQKSTRLVDRDVEAPNVFQVTEDALWDGRPSLGGVWVASPDAKDPERVIMRNPANGKFVIGALFRRERDNPGPKLQISSDAAAALGMLAGAPAKLSVTALRREEAPAAAPTSPILDSAETVASAPAAGAKPGAIDGGGVATQPLDAPQPAAPAKKGPAATAATAAAAIDAAAPAPAPAASGGRPIQIGIFSVEANAKRAVDTLAKAGVPAEVRSENAKGKSFWSVIARGDAATLKKIKSAGFADAYLLK